MAKKISFPKIKGVKFKTTMPKVKMAKLPKVPKAPKVSVKLPKVKLK